MYTFKIIAVWKKRSDKIAIGQSGNKKKTMTIYATENSLFQRFNFFHNHQTYLFLLDVTPKVLTVLKKIYYLHY